MERLMTHVLLCSFFLVLVLHASPAISQEVEDERDFNYVVGSDKGPDRWGDLHEDWSMCKYGNMQSPIDLLNERVEVVPDLGRLDMNYRPSRAILRNRGHDMMLRWDEGAGSLTVNGTQYELKQCHWHTPSEHFVDGKRFALEIHLVHESADGKTAVIGKLYRIGPPDCFLSMLRDDLIALAGGTDQERYVGMVDPRDIKIGSKKYYRYIGSLTVPPCTEDILWTIADKVGTVSPDQVDLLRVAVHDESNSNARPLQPLNGRSVLFNTPRVDYEK